MIRNAALLCSLMAAAPAYASEGRPLTSGVYVATTPVTKAANEQAVGTGMVLADAASGDVWSFQHVATAALPMGPHEDPDALIQALFPFEKTDAPTDLSVAGAPGRAISGAAQGMHWRVCYRWIDDGFGMLSRGSAKAPAAAAVAAFEATCAGIAASQDRWAGPKPAAVGLELSAANAVRWQPEAKQEANLLTAGFLVPEHASPVSVVLALYPTPPLTEEAQRAEWLTAEGLQDVRRLQAGDVTGFQWRRVVDEGRTVIQASVAAPGRVWSFTAFSVGPTQGQVVGDWLQAAVQGATFEFERPEPTPEPFERPAESATGRKKKKK